MAVLNEANTSTADVTIDDTQVGDLKVPLSEDQKNQRQLI